MEQEMKDEGLECETCLYSLTEEACDFCQNHNRWQSLDEPPPMDEIDWLPEDVEKEQQEQEDDLLGFEDTTLAY